MNWLEHSIMSRKGVAGGRPGARHSITIADQGAFHYDYGPHVAPVLEVDPVAVVLVETHDAFEGKIRVDIDGVYWSDTVTLPCEPFIGTIGTSPAASCCSPARHPAFPAAPTS